MFVHLTPQKNIKSILRNGIKKSKYQDGIFALPVVRNYAVSHQWLRELSRFGKRNFVAVYFRIDDAEKVLMRHYTDEFVEMSAVESEAIFNNIQFNPKIVELRKRKFQGHKDLPLSPLGYEVVIPRKISNKEIFKIRNVSQVLGWRFFPYSNGNRPKIFLCYERGSYGVRKIEQRVEKERLAGKESKIIVFGR